LKQTNRAVSSHQLSQAYELDHCLGGSVHVKLTHTKTSQSSFMTRATQEKFDSCHHNSVNLDFTLKIMPLNGMDFNMKSNFKKL